MAVSHELVSRGHASVRLGTEELTATLTIFIRVTSVTGAWVHHALSLEVFRVPHKGIA